MKLILHVGRSGSYLYPGHVNYNLEVKSMCLLLLQTRVHWNPVSQCFCSVYDCLHTSRKNVTHKPKISIGQHFLYIIRCQKYHKTFPRHNSKHHWYPTHKTLVSFSTKMHRNTTLKVLNHLMLQVTQKLPLPPTMESHLSFCLSKSY